MKKVWRHLRNGDCLLVNRQPTLHKPGIMAHYARVLKNERVIRMHYANCNTYNADYDGDEMNLHMVQNELARAEGYHIAGTDHQYVVPTNGKPLRGLIQDHVVMGVLLTCRDTFLSRGDTMQLLYLAGVQLARKAAFKMVTPAILKPAALWTGKQVITMLLLHLHPDAKHLNMHSGTKTAADMWAQRQVRRGEEDLLEPIGKEEAGVVVRNGELLLGVLDKASFGATEFGLVHSVHELLGGEPTGQLLTQLGKLFTGYNQMHGFTCGIGDLLITPAANKARAATIARGEPAGMKAAMKFGGLTGGDAMQLREALRARIALEGHDGPAAAELDSVMKSALMPLTSECVGQTLPAGQQKTFPDNQFALMTGTGAKGGGVNFSQISVMLGQQELEGRRVPLSPSGCTAPCFAPFELTARAGGYITDRFLTGVRPPEFYFHCMAGREGLVDTAVKTSRSGYLQRCLIKHLEPLVVGYDHTTRSSVDGSIVQFVCGEDGLDPCQVQFLKEPSFFAMNTAAFLRKWHVDKKHKRLDPKKAHETHAAWQATPEARRPVRLAEQTPSSQLGATSEAFAHKVGRALERALTLTPTPTPTLTLTPTLPLPLTPPLTPHPTPAQVDRFLEEPCDYFSGRPKLPPKQWRELMWRKYHAALQQPGEAVGLLAAQSVGEPSTQMTLNTFHHAGRGEANVTLGIPRMREIIMVASQHPSTPLMTLPMRASHATEAAATQLATQLARLRLSDMLKKVEVEERCRPTHPGGAQLVRRVRITLRLAPYRGVSAREVYVAFEAQLLPLLKVAMKKHTRNTRGKTAGDAITARAQRGRDAVADAEGGAAGGAGDDDVEVDAGAGGEVADEDGDDAKAAAGAERRQGAEEEAESDEEDRATLQAGRSVEAAAEVDEGGEAAEARPAGAGDDDDEEAPVEAPTPRARGAASDAAGGAGGGSGARRAALLGAGLADYGQKVEAKVLWIELELDVSAARMLLVPMMGEIADKVLVRHTKGIQGAVVVPAGKGRAVPCVQTAGINFEGMSQWEDAIDLHQVKSNDVHAVLMRYGVEAARQTITKEISSVFGVYGISVDERHLGLIADYMTHEGGYKPLNRNGIESCCSSIQKMTFETTTHFLAQAAINADADTLGSPSSSIVLGKAPRMGTGAFEVRSTVPKQPAPPAEPAAAKRKAGEKAVKAAKKAAKGAKVDKV